MLDCPIQILFMLKWIYFQLRSCLSCALNRVCGISVTYQLSHSDDAHIPSASGNQAVEADSNLILAG